MSAPTVSARLRALGACGSSQTDAVPWAKRFGSDGRGAWLACTRPDWLLWLAGRLGLRRQCVLAGAICAARALRYVSAGEGRPRAAIVAAVRYGRGRAVWDLRTRRRAADAANAAAAYAAYAAAYAADVAARAWQCGAIRRVIPWEMIETAAQEVGA